MSARERCPNCIIAIKKQYPPILCRALGEPLTKDGWSNIIRSENCPIPNDTDANCYVLPEKSVIPTIEIKIGDHGKPVKVTV